MMSPRPKLHEVGSLLSQARAISPRVTVTSAKVMPTAVAEPHVKFDEANLISNLSTEFEAPPSDVIDSNIDAIVDTQVDSEVPSSEFIFGVPEAAPQNAAQGKHSELEFVAELTQADKIEAVCEKIHPAIRQFIEEELRTL